MTKETAPAVLVQPEGQILLGPFTQDKPFGTELWQSEAITLALELVVAVQKSINRNQPTTASPDESPLGRAVKALLDTNFDGVRQAWLNT